jgi:predicted Rossmann fold flavoprotein
MKIAIIGGGAAGFFAAISAKTHHPETQVHIFEKAKKTLIKVGLTGGGRCNISNAESSFKNMIAAYPRGGKLLKKAFKEFDNKAIVKWFETRGVLTLTQEDNCIFPQSQNSQTVIDCLIKEAKQLGITIHTEHSISAIEKKDTKLMLHFKDDQQKTFVFHKIIVTTGGAPQKKSFLWLEKLGHRIEQPIPSLFTFNMPNESIKKLMGIVVENAMVSLQGSKLKASGPLLITHWGMSGPAILKLSSFGARILQERDYEFRVQVNWVNIQNDNIVRDELNSIIQQHPHKQLANYRPYLITERLWHFLLKKAQISLQKKWNELGKKHLNKIVHLLTNDIYQVEGKTTFREEFVTCGGVSLSSINPQTLESLTCPNLYFAGEVLDIDGITGGYNLQAAWTTGFIAGKLQ